MQVAGVDATRQGWVAVVLEDWRFDQAVFLKGTESTFDELHGAAVIGIDIPIGFGPNRLADAAARRFLRGAASSVFSAPTREQIDQPFGPGLGLSAQAHALGPRVVHVTAVAARDTRFREVHPEVSFRAMNGGVALRNSKKTAGGAFERVDLLRGRGIQLGELGSAGCAPLDDVLDAAAAAWSAARIAAGTAVSLPDPPERRDGVDVAIWY